MIDTKTLDRDTHDTRDADANRDPLSGAPGAHPIGTGLGAAAGGVAAGAAIGTVAGPVGTLIGAAVGAVVGGLAGKGVAEMIDPTVEDAYWRSGYAERDYVSDDASYDDYGPAYRYGVNAYKESPDRSWNEVESEMATGWQRDRDGSSLDWETARPAARDSWTRLSDRFAR